MPASRNFCSCRDTLLLASSAVARQAECFDVGHPVGVALAACELGRRHVHAHLQFRRVVRAPVQQLAGRVAEHAVADRHDEAGFLGQRDEIGRADQATLRMHPAQQRLGLVDAPAAQADDGLVVQHELVVVDRGAQVLHQLLAPEGCLLHRTDEVVEAVAPGILGAVHRLIGVADQAVGVAAVLRVNGDADAG